MKKIFKILLAALLFSGSIVTANQATAQTSVSVNLSVFQKTLSPYGRWVNHGSYGQVWIANDRNFRPYSTGGHWAYTDYGWTWVSDYDWGWAPFHYGRWNYEPSVGWYWVPGYDWGPAWVAWRGGGDYYGWAPLSSGLDISVGVSFGNQIPYDRWVFAPHRYITSPYVSRYYVPRTRNVTIIKNTTVVNNVVVKNNVHVDAGPRREDVERINRTKIRTYTVANSSRPGKTVVNNNTINVYRPVVNKTTVNNNETVINKNSNNTSVSKTNNKTVVNKNNNNKTTVNKNSNNVNKTNTTVKNQSTNKNITQHQQNNRSVINNNANNKKAAVKRNNQAQQKNAFKQGNNNNNNSQVKKQKQNPPNADNKGRKKK